MQLSTSSKRSTADSTQEPTFRSAAVARMVGMPVATLRVWEQRYQAVQPTTAASGHRLYSPADVQRVTLLRQLTEQGHAIGSIAGLELNQLREIATVAPRVTSEVRSLGEQAGQSLRVAVVGVAFAARLQRPSVTHALNRRLRLVSIAGSPRELASTDTNAVQVLLFHVPELQAPVVQEIKAAWQPSRAERVAIVYRFAVRGVLTELEKLGAITVREPSDDIALASWVNSSLLNSGGATPNPRPSLNAVTGTARTVASVSPRRYDDETLTSIAGIAPTVACECPRHIAELLMQISSFESYSAACINTSATDAKLHEYLQQVAGASRVLFEAALERVAQHEGISLR